jgi:hypothetical protein
MGAKVRAEHARQRQARAQQRGHPPATVVTGYLIGDDSTQHKVRGNKMAGLGKHYSSSEGKRVTGHSLVQGLYVLLGEQCPLLPRLYQQRRTCETNHTPFRSKVDWMEEVILTFEPVEDTHTHVLMDAWYSCKRLWRAARQRGFDITVGLKANRVLRTPDGDWQTVSDYAANLTADQFVKWPWPSQEEAPREVYVHVVQTRIRKLYRCQLIIVRPTLDCPLSAIRFWASSDLAADTPTLMQHIAMRWTIEVLFADTKELLGLDHYQLMSLTGIVRFWTLVMGAFVFLDEQRTHLQAQRQAHVTLGEARQEVQRVHRRHWIDWMHEQFSSGVTPQQLYELLAA